MKKLFSLFSFVALLLIASQSFAYIGGTLGVCVGNTTTLIDSAFTSGTWTSSNPSVATVGITTGVVTGVSAGTTTISLISGSGVSTAIFTVSAPPGAITGGGTICVGSTLTLSNSVPGGIWSTTSSSISVNPTTGVVTGLYAAVPVVYYSMGTGCSASTTVTVAGAPVIDTVYGPSSVCVGGVVTFTCATVGTWSVSNPAIATISSSGVLTGVSTGSVVVSYGVTGACGVAYRTRTVSVGGATSAGTIGGSTTVGAGFSISLYNTVAGGSWSSSNPTVATVTTTGGSVTSVTGVTPGTAIISYAVTGCGGVAYATALVTVTTSSCITGDVLFGGTPFTGNVKVWLIKYDAPTHMLSAVDSTVRYSTGTSASYSFCGLSSDSFRVKAAVIDSAGTLGATGYLPTYHTSSAFWNTATVINHVAGTVSAGKNINMGYGTTTAGPGFIAGDVTTGANKGTADGDPVVGMLIYCVNTTTGAIMQQDVTDASGHYTFSNLPVDHTYTIYPESINYATTPYPPINLTSSSASMTVASFRENTLSLTITPITSSITSVDVSNSAVGVFPNPTSGVLNIQWHSAQIGSANVLVSDITGRVVSSSVIDMSSTNGVSALNLNNVTKGIYMVSVKGNGVNYNTKVVVE